MTRIENTDHEVLSETGADRDAPFRRVRLFGRAAYVAAVSGCFLVLTAPVLLVWRGVFGRDAFLGAFGACIARLAETLGPVPTKLAQMASYRTDLLPAAFLAPLGRLQDRVGGRQARQSGTEIEAALGRGLAKAFASFDPVPIGVGSVANVYKAVTASGGQLVAVKVVRRRASLSIDQDLTALQAVLRLAAATPWLLGVPVIEVFEYVARMIRGQADMTAEAAALDRFNREFSGNPRILFPRVFHGLSTGQALVMSFEGGRNITDSRIEPAAFKSACGETLRALYQMMFMTGHIHCDLHPGNLFVHDDGTVVLVDAGMTAQLSDADRLAFRSFFLAFALRNRSGFSHSIISSAMTRPNRLDREAVAREAGEILDTFGGAKAGEFLVAGFVYRLFELQRRHGLFGAPGFVNAIWALVMLEGIVRDRFPELDFQAAAVPFFTSGLIEEIRFHAS